jgi:hypothetical protein
LLKLAPRDVRLFVMRRYFFLARLTPDPLFLTVVLFIHGGPGATLIPFSALGLKF